MENEKMKTFIWVPGFLLEFHAFVYEIISASADSLHWAPILEDGLKMEANNH